MNATATAYALVSAPTLASVTAWHLQREEGYRSAVPAMPREERAALVALSNRSGKLAGDEAQLLEALRRKLRFRAARERD